MAVLDNFEYSNPLAPVDTGESDPVTVKKEVAIRKSTQAFAKGAPAEEVPGAYMKAGQADPVIEFNNDILDAKYNAVQGTALAVTGMAQDDAQTLAKVQPQHIQKALDAATQQYDGELGPEYAYIDNLGEDMSESDRDSMAANLHMRRQIAQIWDEHQNGNPLLSADGMEAMFFPAYTSALQGKLLNDVEDQHGSMQAFWNFASNAQGIEKIRDHFNQLSPKERLTMFTSLKNEVERVTDNKVMQMQLLQSLTGLGKTKEDIAERAVWDATDVGSVADVGFKVLRGMSSGIRGIKAARSVASTVADVSSRDSEVASAMNMTREEAATSAAPIAGLTEIQEGAAPEIATDIQKNWSAVDALIDKSKNFVREGVPLTEDEKLDFATKKVTELEKRPEVSNVTFQTTDAGVQLKYDIINPITEKTVVKNVTPTIEPYTQDAVRGGFLSDKIGVFSKALSKAVSPNTSLGKDSRFFVDTFTRILGPRAKIRKNFQKAMSVALKGVDNEGMEKVDSVLKYGTLHDEVYSYRDLVKGDRPDLPQLTDAEFKAYATTRHIADRGWELMNEDLYRQSVYRGDKTITIGDRSAYGRAYDDPQTAGASYRGAEEKYVWDPEHRRIIYNLSPEDMKTAYDRGYKLTRLSNPNDFWEHSGESMKYALVKDTAVSDLDRIILNRRKGYMPLIYKNAYHFVKEEVPMSIDGKSRVYNKTLRYFDNVKDAEEYAADLKARNPHKTYKVLRDREMSSSEKEEDMVNIFGGRFRGTRAGERIGFGKEGAEAQFISPIQALGSYFGNISTRYPISELKLALQDRWMNQARKYLPNEMRSTNFQAARGIVAEKLDDPFVRDKMLIAHDQVSQMMHVMSREERDFSNMVNSIAERLDRGDHRKLAQGLYRINQSDPIQNIKSSAFNALLGLFSPAQFLVQAMGSTVAMSISPEHAAEAFKKMIMLHFIDGARTEALKESHLARIEKFVPDIRQYYKVWDKSGLFDSAVSAQGDYRIAASGIPVTKSMFSKFMERGRMFFESGELYNTRISFGTAYEEWKKANPEKVLGDADVKSILARTEDFRLNMSQSNRAWFQKGWQSIPFQFQQIATKSIEAMLGTKLSMQDKTNLLLGQLMMFGASGVPYGQSMLNGMMAWCGVQPQDINPTVLNAVQSGMIGAISEMAGIDAETSTRFGNLNAVEESLTRFFSGDYSLPELLSGAFGGGVYGRVFGFGSHTNGFVENMLFAGKVAWSADDLTAKDAANMFQFLAESAAEIPTSTRNAIYGYLMYNNQALIKSDGQPLWQQNVSVGQAAIKALGFSSKSLADYYDAKDGGAVGKESLQKHYVNLSVNLINKMAMAWENDDANGIRATGLVLNWIDKSFADNPQQLYNLRKAVEKELLSGTNTKDQFIRKMIMQQLRSGDQPNAAMYNPDIVKQFHQGENQ